MIKRIIYNFIIKINTLFFASKDEVSDFTFEKSEFCDDTDKVLHALDTFGIVVIKNCFPRNNIQEINSNILNFIKKVDLNHEGDCGNYIMNSNKNHKLTYKEIMDFEKSIVNYRERDKTKTDGGMIDIFKIEKILEKNTVEILNSIHDLYRNVLEIKIKKKFSHFNSYINHGVGCTRVAHIDSVKDQYKCMIYLTDVQDSGCGPYSYVPRSHKKKLLLKFSTLFQRFIRKITQNNSYLYDDMPIHDDCLKLLLGESGTLIISNQSGIHRGQPQKNNAFRLVLVDNYF